MGRGVGTESLWDGAVVRGGYILGMMALVVALSSVLQLLRQGMFSLGMNVIVLALAVPLSWFGGLELGLSGAAAGSVCALYVDRILVLQRIAAISGVPVREQQHWASLGRHLLWTVVAALAAWLAVHTLFAGAPPIARLAVGASVLVAIYGATNWRNRT